MSAPDPFEDFRSGLEDPQKRARLLQLLIFGAVGTAALPAQAWFWESKSKKLADDQSIFTLTGEVTVNGKKANQNTRIRAGDTVRTGGGNSEVIFAVGGDSFLLRENSELVISGSNFFIDSLRMLSGRLLSVFARRDQGQQLQMISPTATIGIRGTGVYLESTPDEVYLCTCYGQVSLSSTQDPNDSELITTSNHDAPRYISSQPSRGTRIRRAPVVRHTNEELRLLENIVGRDVPRRLRKAYDKD